MSSLAEWRIDLEDIRTGKQADSITTPAESEHEARRYAEGVVRKTPNLRIIKIYPASGMMAGKGAMSAHGEVVRQYDTDIVSWSSQQTTLLRRHAGGDHAEDEAIDWPNVIEEIESVGQSQVDAVESLLYQALLHDLKAQAWPQSRDVANWRGEARGFRAQARRKFRESMRHKLDIPGLYQDALEAIPDAMDGRPPLRVSKTCPVTLDELLSKP
jgi:hypothetical protein